VHHHGVHGVVDIGHSISEKIETGAKIAKAVSASEAFRKYDWLRNVPVRNASGDFRGMVVSKRWATIFNFAENALKPIEKIVLLATLAENIVKAHHEIDSILASKDDSNTKAARLSTQVSSIAIRTVGGIVPAGAHVLATSLSGYCQIAGLTGLQEATRVDQKLRSLDAFITSFFDKVTDGENINIFINNHLVIR
jgi:hypothetical protein